MKFKKEFFISDKDINNKFLKYCCRFTIGKKIFTTSLTGFLSGIVVGVLAAYILLTLFM